MARRWSFDGNSAFQDQSLQSSNFEDVFVFKAPERDQTNVDYDDDGDLDLYVINSPGGDNAVSRGGVAVGSTDMVAPEVETPLIEASVFDFS